MNHILCLLDEPRIRLFLRLPYVFFESDIAIFVNVNSRLIRVVKIKIELYR